MGKTAKVYDYQARAREFKVNDWVVPFGANPMEVGRITQVWPGIAQADVEFSHSNVRYPIEDLKKINKRESEIIPPDTVSIPGGLSLTSVSAGPESKKTPNLKKTTYLPTVSKKAMGEMAQRVALYWHKSDRNYRSTKAESATGKFCCPKKGCTSPLRKAVYKRREGKSDHLYVCPKCLFMVKDLNIHRETEMAPPPDPVLPPMPVSLPEQDQIFIHEIMAGADDPKTASQTLTAGRVLNIGGDQDALWVDPTTLTARESRASKYLVLQEKTASQDDIESKWSMWGAE